MKQSDGITLESALKSWISINFQSERDSLNPPVEMILFKVERQWKCLGPVNASIADVFVVLFRRLNIECFICLEEEFRSKWLPQDEYALDYFPK